MILVRKYKNRYVLTSASSNNIKTEKYNLSGLPKEISAALATLNLLQAGIEHENLGRKIANNIWHIYTKQIE
jgi:hypothetical protein